MNKYLFRNSMIWPFYLFLILNLSAQSIGNVEFSLKGYENAKSVTLVATFNNFDIAADSLKWDEATNLWQLDKNLPAGNYEYRFVVDGEKYLRDPQNTEFGGVHSNSILFVDPPEMPHFEVLSPLPGAEINKFPGQVIIQYQPGTTNAKPDRKKSFLKIDGKRVKIKYKHKQKQIIAPLQNLPEGNHTIEIRLVDKKENSAHPYKSIFVVNRENRPPQAEAGFTVFASPGKNTLLNGGLSFDPDFDEIKQVEWTSLNDPAEINLKNPESLFPEVYVEKPGNYSFLLRVSDGKRWSKPDTVSVICRNFFQTTAQFQLPVKALKSPTKVKSVSLAGEFNQWKAGEDPLQWIDSMNCWQLQKAMPPGKYEYKYLINEQDWIIDPVNPVKIEDGWNGFNSVKTIQPSRRDSLKWRYEFSGSAIHFRNNFELPFEVIADAGNPAPLNIRQNEVQLKQLPKGNYYIHLLAKNEHLYYAPRVYLIKNSGHGNLRIIDFHATPGWAGDAIVYQIYLRNFAGEGKSGNLKFLQSKLDYLQSLGINCIWLMPVMESPTDHGYTPVDYFSIKKAYGNLDDYRKLIAAAHARGIKIVFDFIANHSSDQHPYFLSAWHNKNSFYRNWYKWQGERQYEFHNNWDQLPNLNYENPSVRKYIIDVATFWIDVGVDAFRCDAAWGVPHNFWKDFRKIVKGINPQVVLLDEVLPRDVAYHDLEFDMSYDTDFYGNVLDVFRGRKSAAGLQFGLQKTLSNYPSEVVDFRYIENQDMDRFISQFGIEATKAAAALLFTLPGMPLVYYGQEIGLREMRQLMVWNGKDDLFSFYQELIRLRQNYSALRKGSIRFLATNHPQHLLCYVRELGDKKIRVLINFSNHWLDYSRFPEEREGQILFSTQNTSPELQLLAGQKTVIEPYGFVVTEIKTAD